MILWTWSAVAVGGNEGAPPGVRVPIEVGGRGGLVVAASIASLSGTDMINQLKCAAARGGVVQTQHAPRGEALEGGSQRRDRRFRALLGEGAAQPPEPTAAKTT